MSEKSLVGFSFYKIAKILLPDIGPHTKDFQLQAIFLQKSKHVQAIICLTYYFYKTTFAIISEFHIRATNY